MATVADNKLQAEISHASVNRSADEGSAPTKTICQVLHSLHVGGAEMLAYRLATQLREQFRFVFACLDDLGELGEELRNAGFPVEVLGRKAGLDVGCAVRLARFCKRHAVDLVHAHQFTPFFYSLVPKVFWRRPRVLFTEHGRTFPDFPRRKRMLFNRLMLRRKDRVVAVGGAVRQALIDNEGIPADRIDVIYNGVDLTDFSPQPERRDSVRRELRLADDEFAIMQVARLDPVKDHTTALKTMRRLSVDLPNARLFIVGDGPERAHIERQIAEWDLGNSVKMLGTRTDVSRLLQAADCFLLTSLSEGIPVTLIEAMGASVPVVATDVGGNGEVVVHDESGVLAPAEDDDQLAAGIIRLSRDASFRERVRANGRARVLRLFSEASMHDGYLHAYRDALHV